MKTFSGFLIIIGLFLLGVSIWVGGFKLTLTGFYFLCLAAIFYHAAEKVEEQ